MASSSSSSSDDCRPISNEGHESLQGLGGDLSALQKHVAFFDQNKDGTVYPWETYRGFRAIGCGIFLSAGSAFLINLALSRKTRPIRIRFCRVRPSHQSSVITHHKGKFPSLLLPIEIKNIHMAKHGSDSGVYDSEGRYTSCPEPNGLISRFVPSKFEEIFTKHAGANSNALTSDELLAMLKYNRVPKDYSGWLASWTEWKILYFLCKDKNGLLHKETIRAVYDGSLFERMQEDRASARKKA
ncbi:putative peroxygenase 4 [Vitis vinifera]|uniref:Putative peroxygenase 4 n=1 Tax=Vitis vinifera TaxID=29760 RepID=A0A438JTY9_VITVI|nr:putative peroxygenase 4 [Vitis vinifera]